MRAQRRPCLPNVPFAFRRTSVNLSHSHFVDNDVLGVDWLSAARARVVIDYGAALCVVVTPNGSASEAEAEAEVLPSSKLTASGNWIVEAAVMTCFTRPFLLSMRGRGQRTSRPLRLAAQSSKITVLPA